MIKIVFVCLGNICRSPSAEAVFQSLVDESGLDKKILVDSAGTSAYHAGESADSRMISHARDRGYQLTSRSRQFIHRDFNDFDYIVAMDIDNYRNISRVDRDSRYTEKIKMMNDFSVKYFNTDVPDPYYGGDSGFENVLNILEESCRGFFNFLKENHKL